MNLKTKFIYYGLNKYTYLPRRDGMAKLKAVHYINQFYAGLGGEESAHMGMTVLDEKKGPALGLEKEWGSEMEVVKIIACGDNFINTDDKFESIKEELLREIKEAEPDVFIAGPAFNAGRYGVACAKMCDLVKRELGIKSVCAMWHENPAIRMYVQNIYILPTAETATGMKKSIPALAKFALKLAKGEKIGPARAEGYFKTGHRYNEYNKEIGAKRVVDILLKKLRNEPYETEVPLRSFDKVPPAPPVADMKNAVIALITTGGLVPVGNPDKLKQAFSVTYGKYNMTGLTSLEKGVYESIHGGYDTTFASADPHRLIPYDQMLELKKEGAIKDVYHEFFSTCGIGTNIDSSISIGASMAKALKEAGVSAAIMTTT